MDYYIGLLSGCSGAFNAPSSSVEKLASHVHCWMPVRRRLIHGGRDEENTSITVVRGVKRSAVKRMNGISARSGCEVRGERKRRGENGTRGNGRWKKKEEGKTQT